MNIDLIYLLDFQALAEHGSFSRAAAARNVTQPAFGRRVRALEDWAGVTLFQRGTSPVTLTAAGRALQPAIEQTLKVLENGRADAHAAAARVDTALHFAATHVLSFTFFPAWLRGLEGGQPLEAVQLSSDSLAPCEQLIQEGRVHFLLCHAHAAAPVRLDPERFVSLKIGGDILMPVAAPDHDGAGRFDLSGADPGAIPYLGYNEQSGLGRIIAAALPAAYATLIATPVFRSHLAAALRGMVLMGSGVAWLPRSLVEADLAEGRLVRAGRQSLEIGVDVRLFRPTHGLGRAAERFWARLT